MNKTSSIDKYKSILKNNSNNHTAKQNIVNEYIKSGETEEAIKFLKQCINKNRYDVISYFILGNIYLSTKEYTKSVIILERARQINPKSSDVINNLGMSYYNLGDLEKAKNCFTECIEIKSDHYIAYSNIARIFFIKENYKDAINFYSKALSFSNEHIESLEGIGKSYYNIKKFKIAIKYLVELKKYKKNDESLLNIIGVCYFNTNQISEAINYFKKIIKINPESTEALKNLSICYSRIDKNSEKAINYASKLLKLDPNSYEALKIFSDCAKNITIENTISENIEFKNNLLKVCKNKNLEISSISNITIDILKKSILSKGIEDFINNYDKEKIDYQLYTYLLTEGPILSPYLEIFSRKLRNHFINLFKSNKSFLISSDHNKSILFALAQQAFLNEYLWINSEEESYLCDNLLSHISKSTSPFSETLIYLLASYQYIGSLIKVSKICKEYKGNDKNFIKFIDLHILNSQKEREIQKEIKSFSKILNKTSLKVQSQYEVNPYPRWTKISLNIKKSYSEYIQQQIYPNSINIEKISRYPSLLIAGCGTGKHTLYTASSINANITSIDISKASLAYAKRESDKRGYRDIEFIHGDILDLDKINMNFDIIESIGVLHHMKDPKKGLESLLRALKPGGFIKLGLYSKIARKNIQYFRKKISKNKIDIDDKSIKNFRNKIFFDESKSSNSIKEIPDFYSTSEFRDLIFHFQEKHYDIKNIEQLLEQYNLTFLGFEFRQSITSKYLSYYPEDKKLINLENWRNYELNNPNTFLGMYNFWCYKNTK